jgi:uncharacterized cupin superfamily protein
LDQTTFSLLTEGEEVIEPGAWIANIKDAKFEPYEAGRVHWLRREEDGGRRVWAGIWEVAPDEMPPGTLHESENDETFHLLSGSLRLEIEDGETLELGTGSIVSLRKGTRARWTVLEPIREFFVYCS